MKGLEKTPEKNVKDFARLYKAYKEYIKENGIGALSSRCWPDFFTSFGTPVCSVLSLLNAEGIAASCEADVYGALSMYIGNRLTGKAVFFGDPVSMDEAEGTVTYWHCGGDCVYEREAGLGAAFCGDLWRCGFGAGDAGEDAGGGDLPLLMEEAKGSEFR